MVDKLRAICTVYLLQRKMYNEFEITIVKDGGARTAEIGLSFARDTILLDCPPEIWEGLPKHVNCSASEENQEQHIGT